MNILWFTLMLVLAIMAAFRIRENILRKRRGDPLPSLRARDLAGYGSFLLLLLAMIVEQGILFAAALSGSMLLLAVDILQFQRKLRNGRYS